MKKILIAFCCCFTIASYAQTLERVVIGAAGQTFVTPTVKLKTSIGEPIVGKVNDGGVTVSQGFFTGSAIPVTGINDPLPTANAFILYPNPVESVLFIKGNMQNLKRIEISNMIGQVLMNRNVSGNELLLANLQAGMYIARLFDRHNKLLCLIKIVKQ